MNVDAPNPQISVILPAFNVADHIAAAIASLKAQRLANFEAIVIDDGSVDTTAAVAQAAIMGDARFRMIRQANRGLSGARNVGLDLARAPVIGFLDADDRFDPDFLLALHTDLSASGADWVACGIAFTTPDGTHHPHSAIHGRPVLADTPEATTWPLDDWTHIIPHFPSAWNKLYRRDFIGATRFDEGLWFEDHGFFHSLAARSSALRHIARPLYLYTRDRDGQITRADSDRVFDQFTVLERSAQIMRTSGKPGAEAGLARLATRLCLERLGVIHTPERRARFTAQAADFMARHGLTPEWRWDPFLNALEAASLGGQAPVTLRIAAWVGETSDVLPEPASPLARFFQLAEAGQPLPPSALVLDLPVPMALDHQALAKIAQRLLHDGLDAAILPIQDGAGPDCLEKAPPEGGSVLPLTDLGALVLSAAFDCCQPQHALLARAEYASRIDWADPTLRLAEQTLRLVDARAQVIVGPRLSAPGATLPDALPSLRDCLAAIDAWRPRPITPLLPPGWDRKLALRAASAQILKVQRDPVQIRRRLRLLLPLLRLWWVGQQRGWIGSTGEIDADTPRVVQRLFRAQPPG